MNENSLTKGGRWFHTHLALPEPKKKNHQQPGKQEPGSALLCCVPGESSALKICPGLHLGCSRLWLILYHTRQALREIKSGLAE